VAVIEHGGLFSVDGVELEPLGDPTSALIQFSE
jgi:hypothetical protein